MQTCRLIPESDLYRLIISSKLPAEEEKDVNVSKIFSEVLT